MPRFPTLALLLGTLALTVPPVAAQSGEGRSPRAAIDPYTEGDPAAMEKAGYESFGPFRWASSHTTEVVETALGGVPLLWVETEHFKIGSSLDAYTLGGEPDERKKLQADLKRLKKRVRGVKTKAKELDPWLQLHLWAMRLEELYADFCEQFGFEDDMFPAPPGTVPYLGDGRYLGLRDKFCVLLVENKSSLARYTRSFCDRAVDQSYRYYFQDTQSLFFGMARETLEGVYDNDPSMHYAVVYNVAQNLGNGYRGYTHEAPPWWTLGLARWFARKVDPTCLLFTTGSMGGQRFDERDAVWEPKVRARVERDYYPKMAELMAHRSILDLEFNDHMMVWSRVDFVLSLDVETRRELITLMQEPAAWSQAVARPGESLEKQFDAALEKATGMDLEAFDRAWVRFVERTYAKR